MRPTGLHNKWAFPAQETFKFQLSFFHFSGGGYFHLDTWFLILNALVIYWALRFKSCEQGLTRLHVNRIKKKLVLCILNSTLTNLYSFVFVSTQTSVSPWESTLEINDWWNKPQHVGWITEALAVELVINMLNCIKLGKGHFLGARMDGSPAYSAIYFECVSCVRLFFVQTVSSIHW